MREAAAPHACAGRHRGRRACRSNGLIGFIHVPIVARRRPPRNPSERPSLAARANGL
ncbi:conserved hypothetical protein [Burkholderia pseudomallei 406e]|uniref:Uncharacterized protein n=2 Tax=pseudomallei group TaxID=111527 RepID=A2S3N3_BURM9|nr:hypothetical protein BMASAVP1_A1316 [Burkholderia mallei SAVP1]ABN01006.1 hypothetical protein BMA10229_A0555 [Burkholderia mallei NCTC 10229]ABN91397.1 hypothetical protein BURPS1106A_1538 [Burkholderia pseudomallei 1106a]ABO05756.1 hypothetical protein BMA10247_0598 [Burkholderia mallei NCTC 10247]AFR15462.1 hypothetical protein BPC006_I1585 [Burkholderia pseudomallei BPC006]EDK56144.1 hypothetical protein BMAFMH_C0311 [Burkholderia mallei FMH]EDK60297.1 hypothetical protein BMAJHU_C0322